DLVRAVIGAVARADAAVVNLHVEPFGVVHRCLHRAHDLTRRVLALHAGHRLKERAWALRTPGVIAVDAYPMHFTAAPDLAFTHHGNIVLGLAGDRAGGAADAASEIDAHPPFVAVVRIGRIERRRRRRYRWRRARGLRAGDGLVARKHAHDIAPFHAVVGLRRGERVARTGRGERCHGCDRGCGRGAE